MALPEESVSCVMLSVPCGMSDSLPVGMMLVGRHWEDGTVLRAAHTFERIT